MSIQNEIERISMNISQAYDAVQNKGGTVPEERISANLPEAINSIPEGEGAAAFLVKAPVGTIVIWSGTEDDIPNGWHLCDGTDGTPNLKDKFVLGAGSTYTVGATGGSETVTLTEAQMPKHQHSYRSYPNQGKYVATSSSASNILPVESRSGTEYAGSSQPHENMPPYYALCYIMKLTPDETDVSAEEVAFDSGETGLESDNVQGAIEELASKVDNSAGSGGDKGPINWEDINGRPDLSEAASIIIRQVTLTVDGWGTELVQTVPVPGVSADENEQLIVPIPKQTDQDQYYTSGIACVSQDKNFLTFHANSVPKSDLNVNIYILRQRTDSSVSIYKWWSPKMTSSNEPKPYSVSADSSVFNDYYAFDGDKDTCWSSGNGPAHWIQIDMGQNSKSIAIAGARLVSPTSSQYKNSPSIYSIQGSDDGYIWTDICKEDGTDYPVAEPGLVREYYFDESHYRYYRVYIIEWFTKVTGDSDKTTIAEIEFYRAGGDMQ